MGIKKRLYEVFFRPALYDRYESVLRAAKEAGYEFHTVHSFEKAVGGGSRVKFNDYKVSSLSALSVRHISARERRRVA